MAQNLKFIISATDRFSKTLGKAKGSFKQLAASVAKYAAGMVAALAAAGAALFAFGRAMVTAYEKQARAEANLRAALKATGYAAGFTSGELRKQASQLQKLTGVGDETIISGQALLATFKQVKGDQFRDAIDAAIDMQIVLQGASDGALDLRSAITMIGKALNDPILGMSALRRGGVQLTRQQEEQVRAFAASGQIVKAQTVILGELQAQFGGAAREIEGNTKSVQVLADTYGDLKEQIGKAIGDSQTFQEWVGKIQKAIEDLSESGKLEQWADETIEALGGVASAMAGIGRAMGYLDKSVGRALRHSTRYIGARMGGANAKEAVQVAKELTAQELPGARQRERQNMRAERERKQAQSDAKERRDMFYAQAGTELEGAISSAEKASEALPDLIDALAQERKALAKQWAEVPIDMSEDEVLRVLDGYVEAHKEAHDAFVSASNALSGYYETQSDLADKAKQSAEEWRNALAKYRADVAAKQPEENLQADAKRVALARQATKDAEEKLAATDKTIQAETKRLGVLREEEKLTANARRQAEGLKKTIEEAAKDRAVQIQIDAKTAAAEKAISNLEAKLKNVLVLDVEDPRAERAALRARMDDEKRIKDETRQDQERAANLQAKLDDRGRLTKRNRQWLERFRDEEGRLKKGKEIQAAIEKRRKEMDDIAKKSEKHLEKIANDLQTVLRAS